MLEKKIIIIDDFYPKPDLVRQYALEAKYPPAHDGATYPGRNSYREQGGVYYDDEIHKKIENAIGLKVVPQNLNPDSSADCGYFRISLANDVFEQDIHVDPGNDWAGVLFLNIGSQIDPESGTSFWRHKKTGLEHVPMNPDQGRAANFSSYDEIRANLIYGDGLDRNLWDRYCFVPQKYNRLVLFNPYLWHSHGTNFGDNLGNGRLVQLFFYSYAK